ncbi:MAG: hypothetical protein R2991_11090 [Thermoanaerobaculia bacterium]
MSMRSITTLACVAVAAASATPAGAAGFRQTEEDAYTRYELLAPETASFRILYDVTATAPGTTLYFNPIRKGSEPTVHAVTDRASGEALEWSLVEPAAAAADGLLDTDHDGLFLRVVLPRPVPAEGGVRLRIDKTYADPASVRVEGDRLIFERSLGVKRNAVILPAGYELVGCNHPSQVALEPDGRVRVSFVNLGEAPVPFRIEAREAVAAPAGEAGAGGAIDDRPPTTVERPASARREVEVGERAAEDREIVYLLRGPETHTFDLYHDYTESRPGIDRYVNFVRPGSRATEPSARNLDTGEALRVETLRGAAITERGIDLEGEPLTPETEVVVIWFEAVRPGTSTRLRISETYADPGRYGLDGDELLWDRSFGRSRNIVVLPEGWSLTASTMPAVVDLTDDGRVRLRLDNDRPDELQVLLRARRVSRAPR